MLEPTRRQPLYERVVQRLEALIRAEELQPGDRLIAERELAARLGVSRTSWPPGAHRAARARRRGGPPTATASTSCTTPTTCSAPWPRVSSRATRTCRRSTRRARRSSFSYAARLAARRRTDADLAALRAALVLMREEIARGDAGVTGDERFHGAVMAAAHNEVLTTLYEQLAAGLATTSQASLVREGQPVRSLNDHEALLRAIEAGDEERAELTMRLHVRGVLRPRDGPARRERRPVNPEGRTAVVTGAASGIGLAMAAPIRCGRRPQGWSLPTSTRGKVDASALPPE